MASYRYASILKLVQILIAALFFVSSGGVAAQLFVSKAIAAKHSDYPQSSLEREIDEMGSVLGGEGITFTPKKYKSSATENVVGQVNKYLFEAAIEVTKFVPLASADSNSGIIVTEWYVPKNQQRTRVKINVFIKGTIITPEAVEVLVYKRNKDKNGRWLDDLKQASFTRDLERKILRRARELYLQDSRADGKPEKQNPKFVPKNKK